MIFQQPWAWLGLIAVAGPVIAHLLTPHRAQRIRFPILRFLPPAIAPTAQRHRLADTGLLVLRCTIVAVAVAALARPLWREVPQRSSDEPATQIPAPGSPTATSGSSTGPTVEGALRFLSAASERDAVAAAWSAAVATGAPTAGRSDRRTAIVTPLFEGRERLTADSSAVNAPWMFDVLHAVTSDRLFEAAVTRTGGAPATAVTARRGSIDGVEYLLLLPDTPATSVTTAALASAVARAIALPDAPIAGAPSVQERPPSNDGPSDGRWLWLAVLMLLGVESLAGRRRHEDPIEVRRAA